MISRVFCWRYESRLALSGLRHRDCSTGAMGYGDKFLAYFLGYRTDFGFPAPGACIEVREWAGESNAAVRTHRVRYRSNACNILDSALDLVI